MIRLRRTLAVLATAPLLGATILLTGGAQAAGNGATIDHAQATPGSLKLLVSVPGSAAVDLSKVQVTLDGTTTTATAADAATTNVVQRTTILAIDASNSMRGARITEARKAALAYLTAVPANVKVGVVTFNSTVDEAVPPTLDRTAARSAINALTLAQQTSLYEGVTTAISAAGTTGQREVLLLSDGKDTTKTPLTGVLTKIKASGVKLDAVSLAQSDQSSQPLGQMAQAGGGTILSAADPTALSAAYSSEAQVLARQVLVTATVPSSLHAADANVQVSLTAGGQTYTGSAFVAVQGASAPARTQRQTVVPASSGTFTIPTPVGIGAIVAIGLGLLVLLGLLFTGRREDTRGAGVEEQIGSYGILGRRARKESGDSPEGATSVADQFKGVAQRALDRNRSLEANIAQRLDAAGMSVKPAEWLLLHAGIAIAAGLIGGLIGSGSPVLIVLMLILGAVGPWLYLGVRKSRRLAAFNNGLAETLQLVSSSLSAGLSLAQSLDTVVREGTEPIAGEFRRVIVESRLGVTLEDALDGVAQRMDSKDFAWVVMAIRIQRQVGGNLAELLLTVAATLREREYLRRHVSALSAEGRLSCWILGGLPPVFLLYLTLSKPTYVHPLFSTAIGLVMCVTMAVLLTVGIFWMSKVAKVEL